MAEEKKGHVKITVDIEISPSLMDMTKECMQNMPQAIKLLAEHQKKKD